MSNNALQSPWWLRGLGLLLVLAVHGAALGWLWRQQIAAPPAETAAVFVNFIEPAQSQVVNRPKPLAVPKPQPQSIEPEPPKFVSVAPLVATSVEPIAQVMPPQLHAATLAPPAPAKALTAVSTPPSAPALSLITELSVICPQRVAPVYPVLSRRLGETGTVQLRVELSESGEVTSAQVQDSSGYARLDDAAMKAVRSWRCTPASRNGQAVRATALQPFQFVFQGN